LKKFVNDPQNVVTEEIQGLVNLYPNSLRSIDETVVIRADSPVNGKVVLVSGGGSGHEPMHSGYVGKGMLDAAVAGAVFTAPTPDKILAAINSASSGKGVLLVVTNYAGDVMNFKLAEQLASGVDQVEHVIVNDDVAIKARENRRGVAGTILVHKIAGAKAESGASLDEVKKLGERVISNVRSMGVALSSCTNPTVGKPIFTLGENEMEIGIGVHGEAGVERRELQSADRVVDLLYRRVSEDLGLRKGEEVFVLVNGMGGTPLMELLVAARKVSELLSNDGIRKFRGMVGNFVTSLEMAGFSLSLLRVDEEMKGLLLAPQNTPAFPNLV